MRVALFCNDDLTTNIIFAPVLAMEEIDVTGVFFAASPSLKHRTPLAGILGLLRKMSLRYWLYLIASNGCYKLFERLTLAFQRAPRCGPLVSLRRIATIQGVPCEAVSDFADPAFIARIRAMQIDLLLIRVGAIMTKEMLACPRVGTWCVHSSLLPAFKGIAGEFHALRTDGSPIGSTVFLVTPRLDEGPALAQTVIERDDRRSVFDHMLRNNEAASALLTTMLHDRQHGDLPNYSLPGANLPPSYFSWPKPEEVSQARGRGIRLMKTREWLSLWLKAWGIS